MLYTFYGDDFTGSTDVLEQLGSNGIPAVLFVGAPSAEHLAAFPSVEAIGIAGDSRSRSPEWMSAHLPAIFRSVQPFHAPITHYKVCSTFDSSPTTGSIGRALEVGLDVFASQFVPVVVGAPHLRRYVAFGHLFAGAPDGSVQRIDRHPMSRHPVTPMREPELRLHLAAQLRTRPGTQARMKIGLIDDPTLKSGAAPDALDAHIVAGCRPIVFDTVDATTQAAVGDLLWSRAQQRPLFTVGSSGLTAALVSAWTAAGRTTASSAPIPLPRAHPLLVVSGSCSAVTERQIRYAVADGYHAIALDPAALLAPSGEAHAAALASARQSLRDGHDAILYTALGTPAAAPRGDALGIALGILLRDLLGRIRSHPPRLICGGDTSSHAVQQLGIHALTWAANIQPGGPLCRAHADSSLDGLELVLKGGQVGTEDFFDAVRGS